MSVNSIEQIPQDNQVQGDQQITTTGQQPVKDAYDLYFEENTVGNIGSNNFNPQFQPNYQFQNFNQNNNQYQNQYNNNHQGNSQVNNQSSLNNHQQNQFEQLNNQQKQAVQTGIELGFDKEKIFDMLDNSPDVLFKEILNKASQQALQSLDISTLSDQILKKVQEQSTQDINNRFREAENAQIRNEITTNVSQLLRKEGISLNDFQRDMLYRHASSQATYSNGAPITYQDGTPVAKIDYEYNNYINKYYMSGGNIDRTKIPVDSNGQPVTAKEFASRYIASLASSNFSINSNQANNVVFKQFNTTNGTTPQSTNNIDQIKKMNNKEFDDYLKSWK